MVALVTMLTILHRRQRLEHYKKIREYYCEQLRSVVIEVMTYAGTYNLSFFPLSLRQSIITFYSAVTDRTNLRASNIIPRSR
jgi:hypothetical protein